MVYIVENNGVYGLTKGQYSATVEKGSKKKGNRVVIKQRKDTDQLTCHADKILDAFNNAVNQQFDER